MVAVAYSVAIGCTYVATVVWNSSMVVLAYSIHYYDNYSHKMNMYAILLTVPVFCWIHTQLQHSVHTLHVKQTAIKRDLGLQSQQSSWKSSGRRTTPAQSPRDTSENSWPKRRAWTCESFKSGSRTGERKTSDRRRKMETRWAPPQPLPGQRAQTPAWVSTPRRVAIRWTHLLPVV